MQCKYNLIANQEDFIVVFKPSGIPSAPISEDDKDNLFSYVAQDYPQLLNVIGRKQIEHGLIHRLDTVTQGLVIIAKTQQSYEHLLMLQKENKIIKTYTALCDSLLDNAEFLKGFPDFATPFTYEAGHSFTVKSYFRAFGDGRKQVRPVTESSGTAALKKLDKKVLYTTNIKIIENNDDNIKVECEISNGYRHQIRCHLAWVGLPIAGDALYNAKYSQNKMYFCANKINVDGMIFEVK